MSIQVDASLQGLVSRWRITRADAAQLRHVLVSDSVVDWRRLYLETAEDVDRLLAINKLNLDNPKDVQYLKRVHAEAVEFLEGSLKVQCGPEVVQPADLRDLFLMASNAPAGGGQADACMCLKVMNIVHHLNARDLQFRAPVSERDLAFMAHAAISDSISEMRDAGLPVIEFRGGTKSHDSLLLKLLAKRDSLAAQVYDKVRYRLVVESPDDIVQTITHLLRNLVPFNYIIPGQSQNDLIDIPPEEADGLEPVRGPDPPVALINEFSGPTYRQLNFIVDLPLRLDDFLCTLNGEFDELGSVMFVMVEFQIVDRETALANDRGDNRHALYKERQRKRVLRRLQPDHGGDE